MVRHEAGALGALVLVIAMLAAPSTAMAGAWTTPEGRVWSKIALFHLDSDRAFVNGSRAGETCTRANGESYQLSVGDRAEFDCLLEGRESFVTTQLFLEASLGIHRRLDVRIQVPIILDARFSTPFTPASRRGIGDLRFSAQALVLEAGPVVVATNLEVKAPTGFFTVDAIGVPLGEGNWDITARALVSASMSSGLAWGGVELGYRLRLDDRGQPSVDVGDEVLVVAEGGIRPLSWLYLPIRGELLWGFSSDPGPGPDLPARRVALVQTGLHVTPFFHTDSAWKDLGIEWGVRIPVWGRGWTVDPVYSIGVYGSFEAFEAYSSNE